VTTSVGTTVCLIPDGVLDKLQDGEAGRVLVAKDSEMVGTITASGLTRWLRRWRTLEGSAH